jgi:hypothetical protein
MDSSKWAEPTPDKDDDAPAASDNNDNNEARERARRVGWSAPTAYNYESSTGVTREDRDRAAMAALSQNLQDVNIAHPGAVSHGAEAAGRTNDIAPDIPLWAASAAKYEWKEEYGDVGPEVPELEKILFGDVFRNRQGASFDQ